MPSSPCATRSTCTTVDHYEQPYLLYRTTTNGTLLDPLCDRGQGKRYYLAKVVHKNGELRVKNTRRLQLPDGAGCRTLRDPLQGARRRCAGQPQKLIAGVTPSSSTTSTSIPASSPNCTAGDRYRPPLGTGHTRHHLRRFDGPIPQGQGGVPDVLPPDPHTGSHEGRFEDDYGMIPRPTWAHLLLKSAQTTNNPGTHCMP